MAVHNRVAAIPTADGKGFHDFRDALVTQGPIIPVQIEIPAALAQQLQAQNEPLPSPVFGVALIDTGAGVSGIDTSVIRQLQVQPVLQDAPVPTKPSASPQIDAMADRSKCDATRPPWGPWR